MSMALMYWVLMLVWLVFGLGLRAGWLGGNAVWAGDLLLFVLLLLLGWQVFGAPVK